jgi:hypothetical protein
VAGPSRGAKVALLAGAILGALMGIGIALSMDSLYSTGLEGSWRDAIVKDLHTFFSLEVTKGSPLVIAIFALVLLILGVFGALMGVIFSFFVYKFLDFLKTK